MMLSLCASPVESCLSSHPAPSRNVTCADGWQAGGGLCIDMWGTATLTDTNVYENSEYTENEAGQVCSPVEPSLSSHPALRSNVTCAHGGQGGGGLAIINGGTATLTDTNVYKNQAPEVCSPVESSLSSHLALGSNVTCADGWQRGGGLYILQEGTATLTDVSIYKNDADVCSPVEPCLSSHPALCSNVMRAHGGQEGGGLLINYGTATLTDTNVYENQARTVLCLPVEPSS